MALDHTRAELREMTLTDLLGRAAGAFGEDTFVSYGETGEDVSFAELNATANAVGNRLRAWGVQPGETVSVMLHNPLHTVYTMYGIPACGGIYAPVDTEYRGETLAYQLDDADPEVLIVEDRYLNRLNRIADDLAALPEVVVSRTDAGDGTLRAEFARRSFGALLDGERTAPGVDVAWDDEAWLMYTSGTTGDPKGVVLPHRWAVANHATFRSRIFTREDTVHCPLPLNHSGGASALVNAALRGGASVALWDRFSTSRFWERIDRYDATFAPLYGVMISWLRNQPESPGDRRNTLNKVLSLPLPDEPLAFAERFGFEFLFVLFGQTEVGHPIRGLIDTVAEGRGTPDEFRLGLNPAGVRAEAEAAGIPVVDHVPGDGYMGEPRGEMFEVDVVDERDRRLDAGEVGELVVRPTLPGVVLYRYHGKPDRTVGAFGNLWFHTGDAVYRDEEGRYYFVGRLGDIIRKRGENISARRIEEIAGRHDAVAEVAVFPIPAREGGEDEIGMAVRPVGSFDEDSLRDHLAEHVAAYMLPDFLWTVEAMPTTDTDKIRKTELRNRLHDG